MTFAVEIKDLFTVPKDYTLVHCISGDFALGAGIAVQFANRGVKDALKTQYKVGHIGEALLTHTTEWNGEVSLVTKNKCYEKPTLDSLGLALKSLRSFGIKKLAMPKIGCGLDRLQWNDVAELIQCVFEDTDVEILVCDLLKR